MTDAWTPQVNGVVRTLQTTIEHLKKSRFEVDVIEPSMFKRFPLPGYSEVELSYGLKELPDMMLSTMPDYIHIAVEGPLGLAARKFCADSWLRFTTAYHTKFPEYLWDKYYIPQFLTYKYARWFHKDSSKVMVATPALKQELEQHDFKGPFGIWSRGVDTELFHPNKKDDMFGVAYALYVGRVSSEKNIEAFLEADTGTLTKVVVGDGPQRQQLKAKYKDVMFLGAQHGETLAEIYASAHVFVFPSCTDTFGLVMIEALASGTPVVAYNIPNCSSIINDKVGVLSNTADLSSSIKQALTIDREQCRKHAVENYTWSKATKQFVDNLVLVV